MYSADEQRRHAERNTVSHVVNEDGTVGRLVIHARHQDPEGSMELLLDYPDAGEAAVLYTEQGSGHYGRSRHPTLAAAREEWTSFGYAAEAPVPGARRAAAARRTSPVVLGRPGALPASAPHPVNTAEPGDLSRAPF
ncbi:hypothetical protein [Kitasatospora sp. NPDC059327]|uniref:hypothetical protein n=1 Tax=Kitasatospora sp. NPDC059327 TaxID=3346803 RepID=UPI0036AAF880